MGKEVLNEANRILSMARQTLGAARYWIPEQHLAVTNQVIVSIGLLQSALCGRFSKEGNGWTENGAEESCKCVREQLRQ